jgi:hypothetical protein
MVGFDRGYKSCGSLSIAPQSQFLKYESLPLDLPTNGDYYIKLMRPSMNFDLFVSELF